MPTAYAVGARFESAQDDVDALRRGWALERELGGCCSGFGEFQIAPELSKSLELH